MNSKRHRVAWTIQVQEIKKSKQSLRARELKGSWHIATYRRSTRGVQELIGDYDRLGRGQKEGRGYDKLGSLSRAFRMGKPLTLSLPPPSL